VLRQKKCGEKIKYMIGEFLSRELEKDKDWRNSKRGILLEKTARG
jgi:hypothetical protein